MFSSVRKSAGGSARPQGKGANLSFIGPDMVLSGDVKSTGQLHVDGRVDGNVNCETLIQGDGGTIAGNIAAGTAHLAGLVDGMVKARMVTLEATARVTGDVTYETLSIAAGAAIEGRLSRRPDKEPEPAAEAVQAPSPVEPLPVLPPPAPTRKSAKLPKNEEPGLLAGANPPAPAAAAANGR
jgi:cytoskeletal protein CcmA (bactofilin family)